MTLPAPEIGRPSSVRDWHEIRRICCESGDAGQPIAPERAEFFGEHWVGPYQRLRPEWTFIAYPAARDVALGAAGTTDGSHCLGYLTGCPDSLRFEREEFFRFTLPLALRVLAGRYRSNRDTRNFLRRTFRLDRSPKRCFPAALTRTLQTEYPAHLHINVEARARSLGVGALLIDRYCAELRAARVPGVHLYCGPKPVPFYLRNGFKELSRIEFRPGVPVFCLGRKLSG